MRPDRPGSASARPSRPVLALLILLGGLLIFLTQGLGPLVVDDGLAAVRSPAHVVPRADPVSLGGPVGWTVAMAVLMLPRRRAHPLTSTLVGLAAYVAGLALALMALDESTRTGGWGFGWDVAFFVLMLTGVWVPALVVSPALALLTRRR